MAVRLAHVLTRILTWGMGSRDRSLYLAESVSDWESMRADRGSLRMLGCAVRGIPSGLWMRLSRGEITTIPAGIAVALLGTGGLIAGMAGVAYPVTFRLLIATASSGLILGGTILLQDPRQIVIQRYRGAATLVAIGTIGGATNLPRTEQWPHDTPVMETALLDLALQGAMLMIGIGCVLTVLGSFVRKRRRIIKSAAVLLIAGVVVLACAQIVWGVWAAQVDLTITVTSVVMGLAALSMAHVFPRMRHLNVV